VTERVKRVRSPCYHQPTRPKCGCVTNLNVEQKSPDIEESSPKKTRNAIPEDFLRSLGAALRQVEPLQSIIFGSAVVKGLAARDIDLLVVSERFSAVLWQDRPRLLHLPDGPAYDLRLLTDEEFRVFYPLGSPFRTSMETKHIDLARYYAGIDRQHTFL